MTNDSKTHPMRRAKREVHESDALRAIIDDCKVMRIGGNDNEGPFVVPVSFGYDWEEGASGNPQLTLWIHSAQEGRKAALFDREPTVAIEMDVDDGVITGDFACAYSEAYRSIMGVGIIHPVHDAAQKRLALTRVMQHSAPGSPVEFSDAAVERVGIYRIDVNRFTGKMRDSL